MWPQLALTGLSALSGLFGGRPKTTTTESTTDSSGSQSQSGSARRYLTPEQEAAMQLMAAFSASRLADPTQGLDQVLQTQRNKVNQSYAGVPQRIADMTLAHGGARSGKFNKALRSSELARVSALQDVDAQIPALAMSREQQAAQQLLSILGMNMGEDSSAESSFTQSQKSTGKQTGSGDMLGGLLGGAGGMAGFLYGSGKWK